VKEHPPRKCRPLSSNSSTTPLIPLPKKKKKKKERKKERKKKKERKVVLCKVLYNVGWKREQTSSHVTHWLRIDRKGTSMLPGLHETFSLT
jgi:hypothetical protein